MPPGLSDPKYRNPLHAIDLVRFRERSRTLTHISGLTQQDRVLGTGDDPLVVRTAAVSAELLRLAPAPARSAGPSTKPRKPERTGSSC